MEVSLTCEMLLGGSVRTETGPLDFVTSRSLVPLEISLRGTNGLGTGLLESTFQQSSEDWKSDEVDRLRSER